MHIGLIGGIGPAATDVYYRGIVRAAARNERPLDLTVTHADTTTLLENLQTGRVSDQSRIFERLALRLHAAGAECVAVTSIAGHFCIDAFAGRSRLPVVDLTVAVGGWLRSRGLERVGILGTAAVMTSGMYGKLSPIDVLAPSDAKLEGVHDAYVTLAKTGRPTTDLREVFVSAGLGMVERGAEAILLGGTDLNSVLGVDDCPFPIVDCAGIHIDEIAARI